MLEEKTSQKEKLKPRRDRRGFAASSSGWPLHPSHTWLDWSSQSSAQPHSAAVEANVAWNKTDVSSGVFPLLFSIFFNILRVEHLLCKHRSRGSVCELKLMTLMFKCHDFTQICFVHTAYWKPRSQSNVLFSIECYWIILCFWLDGIRLFSVSYCFLSCNILRTNPLLLEMYGYFFN